MTLGWTFICKKTEVLCLGQIVLNLVSFGKFVCSCPVLTRLLKPEDQRSSRSPLGVEFCPLVQVVGTS